MELYIDDKRVDTDEGTGIAVSLSVADGTDPRKGRSGYTRTMRLPMTPANDAVFCYAADLHARDRFNAARHTGRVEHEGAVMIEGALYLNRCEKRTEGGFYEVHIIGGAKEWVAAASVRALRSTGIDYSGELNGPNILASWTNDSPVKFMPVARERVEADFSSGSVVPTVRVLSSDDYHPFIHAGTLFRAIFAESGYRVESDFMDGEEFSSLYISGNYPTRNVETLKADMDFLARRLAPRTAAADAMGRVYADPYQSLSSVGNIVDTVDPDEVASEGKPYDDVFSSGGCFGRNGSRIVFTPTSAVSVGFCFNLRYTTDYRIKNRRELAGFDRVYLGEGSPRIFTLVNPYPDRRSAFGTGRSYTLAVFDHVQGNRYELRYNNEAADGRVSTIRLPRTTVRFSTVSITTVGKASNPALYYDAGEGRLMVFTGDWALYDGFVSETGTLDVEMTVRTAPEEITPGRPKSFDTIYFGGAEPGMKITVSEKTWMRPVFYAQPTEGSFLRFADVCTHGVSQMDFINALRQMFNLRFDTDSRAKTVRVEPARDFYRTERRVDRTKRIDLSKPVVVEEACGGLSREMAWCYRTGDGAVGRFNRTEGGNMGYWSAPVESYAALDGVSVWENPMFTPSLNASGVCSGAPSALVVQVGDGSADRLDRTQNLNFEPKVVRYEGMAPLPAGENWGWPSPQPGLYPKLAFHAPESGCTLCFEDRDGCEGLHSHYDGDVRGWNNARRVTVWLSLDATDVEALSFPTGHGADFRSLYRLTLDGESALYRLEEVCDYRPCDASTKCIFIKHIP